MAWFTPHDFEDRLSPQDLASRSTGSGQAKEPDLVVLQTCLDRAEAEVRGCLAGRAQLPDTLAPGLLRDLALDLAVEGIFLRRSNAGSEIPEAWQARLKRSRALLDAMGSGDIPLETGPAAPTTLNRLAVIQTPSPVDGAFLP